MAKILYVGTHGANDPTEATFPFLLARELSKRGMNRALP
jgi:hypothetical protein